MFNSIISDTVSTLTLTNTLICTVSSIVLGALVALVYRREEKHSSNFIASLMILPTLVQFVIMLVNGNLGAGVAVVGTFSLVRFRSVPGSSKEICYIFLTMAIGLATGMGYVGFAILFTLIALMVLYLIIVLPFVKPCEKQKELRITIPENLDYTEVFDDIFTTFCDTVRLNKVKTTNLGSMYELHYEVQLKQLQEEKKLMDAIRCRNGNLTVISSRIKITHEEL